MKTRFLFFIIVILICQWSIGAAEENKKECRLATPYESMYIGEEATGDHVLGLWQFDGETPLSDVSGKGHDGMMNGAKLVESGRFGGALQSGRGWPDIDQPHQVMVANSPALTPQGAFTIEMWVQPSAEMTGYENHPTLMDKKYVADTDYQFYLSRETKPDTRRLEMTLGFGSDSQLYSSEYRDFLPGVWRHVAFVYDGMGTGNFFVDGVFAGGQTYPERRGIAPGNHRLSIGDRIGSNYRGFPGLLDQVRISDVALEFRSVLLVLDIPRRVFVRMEDVPSLQLTATNLRHVPIPSAAIKVLRDTTVMNTFTLPELAPGKSHTFSITFDTTLRPDTYKLAASITIPGDIPYHATEHFTPLTIVARPLPHTMPVVLWGNALDQLDEARDIGFTHCLGLGCDYGAVWEAGAPTAAGTPEQVAKSLDSLDTALLHNMRVIASLSPGSWAGSQEGFQRIQADGSPYEGDDVCALFPRVQQFCNDVGVTMANTYGAHPAFAGALIHTEVRDHSNLCFHEHDRAAFRDFAGYDIPEGVKNIRGISRNSLPEFPGNGVIPDDYPWYVYYRWVWKQGDGWNGLHTQVHNGLQQGVSNDFWTFYDPAVRCASVFGSGGAVDYLSHWTYSYPDPIRIGLCTDELFCMAAGSDRPDQQVMKMTQIIWYRSQTAPEPGEEAQQAKPDFIDKDTQPDGASAETVEQYQAEWERRIPDARFITIAPMHLREAFWTKISRPIQGIMYHGWGSLVEEVAHSAYRYTHPDTRNELKRLVEEIVTPLGPALMQIPDRPADVAMLESFASEMFAGRGTYGWNGSWAGDMHLILLYAGLQPDILFEESIQRFGLDKYKVLVMPDCDVLPESVVEAVLAFQAKGGIVVGDERLCPAITPVISIETHSRPKEADVARAMNQEKATQLRTQLDPVYTRYVDCSTPDVIPRIRSYGTTDYLFAVNDKREFGDYVGHHGLVMENGLPTDATLSINRSGFVYDLVGNRQVAFSSATDKTYFDWQFAPCDGGVFMITDRPIADITIQVPESASRGSQIKIDVTVIDDTGNALDAVVPVDIVIEDPAGREAECSGYYGAVKGQLSITLQIAENDCPGLWRVHARELASACSKNVYFRVK